VNDLFISNRLNIKKQRFGFVRFQGVQNIKELEYHLNTIWIGTWKLNFNRPKYNRAADTRKEWNLKLKEKVTEVEKEIKKEWRAKGSSTYANSVKYDYRDRAQTQNKENVHAIHFRVEETPREWLSKCYIGRVSDLNKVSSLNESFILGGLGYIKVKFLRGFHVLLKGENEMKINEAIKENKEWFEELFDTIIPWEEQFVAVDKLVWVRCRGLPLKLWNSDCFKHIVALLGTLVEIDEATLALEELEYARFKIRVSVGCEAKITSYMKINEVLYQVSVKEESTVPDYKLCQCHWSEESEGMDSEVGSIASNASARSGSTNFEVGRKVAEENLMAELRNAQPPSEQGHRRLEPIVMVGGSEALSTRPLGPLSVPIFSTIIGKDDLGANSPTTLSRADVDKRIGPSELAQDGLVYSTYVEKEGRCKSKNLLEAPSKPVPIVYGEEKLWNGSFGRLPISKNFISLDESE